MKHHQVEELLGAYALDALPAEEVDEVETHLDTCGRCRDEVAQHRQAASALAGLLATSGGHGGGPAPEDLWERIAIELGDGDLAERPALLPFARPERSPATPGFAGTRLLAAAAVVAIVLAASLGAMVLRQDQRLDRLNERELAQTELAAALVDPKSRRVQLASDDGSRTMAAVVSHDGKAYLVASSLSGLPRAQTYQLWALKGGQAKSLAVLGRELGAVTSFEVERDVEALAITVEPIGGVAAPTTPPVVRGYLTTPPI